MKNMNELEIVFDIDLITVGCMTGKWVFIRMYIINNN